MQTNNYFFQISNKLSSADYIEKHQPIAIWYLCILIDTQNLRFRDQTHIPSSL